MNTPDFEFLHVSTEEYCYSYEQVADMTAISVTLIERFVSMNLVEAQEAKLREADVARIAQMLRLRRDLGLNWVGTSMVLDLTREITRLKARIKAYEGL